MISLLFRYDQASARLEVLGLPDQSAGQKDGTIGIISSWKLVLLGSQQLEGKREHLQALMTVVMQYSRYCLSGVRKTFGDPNSPVVLSPHEKFHQLTLRSSREGEEALKVVLDDAELADLTRCLDDLKCDKRVDIIWELPPEKPIKYREIAEKNSIYKSLTSPLLGCLAFLILSWISLLPPLPSPIEIEPTRTNQSL